MPRILFVLLILAASHAVAAESRRYAALSLLGDELELVVLQGRKTGSTAPNLVREKAKLTDGALDRFIVLRIDEVVRAQHPASKVTMILARDPGLQAAQESILEARSDLADLMPQLKRLADPLNVTHIILVTKHRHEAVLRLARSSTGEGMLSGIGFYIDYNKRLRDPQTGDRHTGYLAAYAYFRISVIDLIAQKVIHDERVLGSLVQAASAAQRDANPWESVTETQKSQMLRYVLKSELDRVVPALLRE